MIRYECEKCNESLETGEEIGGKFEPCPICGHLNAVPLTKTQKKALKKQERMQDAKEKASEKQERMQDAREKASEKLKRNPPAESSRAQKQPRRPIPPQTSEPKQPDPLASLAAVTMVTNNPTADPNRPVPNRPAPNGPVLVRMAPKQRNTPPDYGGVKFIGNVFVLTGKIEIIVGILGLIGMLIEVIGKGHGRGAWVGFAWSLGIILGGLFQMGIGQVFFCIRDMTRNTFKTATMLDW